MAHNYFNSGQGYKLLKAQDVADLTSMSRSHIHRLARDGKFRKPIKIGENRSAWLETEVEEWISNCVRKHHAGGKYAP